VGFFFIYELLFVHEGSSSASHDSHDVSKRKEPARFRDIVNTELWNKLTENQASCRFV